MVERVGLDTMGRLWRPIVAMVFLSRAGGAQAACGGAHLWQAPARIFATVSDVRVVRGETLLFGEPVFRIVVDSAGSPVSADTGFAGLQVSRDGTTDLIPRPTGARGFLYPRLAGGEEGTTEVVWTEPGASPADGPRVTGVFELRSARWSANGGWTRETSIGRFRLQTRLSRQFGSDLVKWADAMHLAFVALDARDDSRLILVQRRGGRWSEVPAQNAPKGVSAVTLVNAGDRLMALAILAPDPAGAVAGVALHFAPHVLWFDGSDWSSPLPLGSGANTPVREPQLIPSGSGTLAAWMRVGVPNVLEWQLIERDGTLGPLQRLPGVRALSSGLEGHRDLLSVAMEDGTGRVLRLRPDGFEDAGRYPARVGFVMPIGGAPGRPRVFVVDTITRGSIVWPTLSSYPALCARGTLDRERPR